MNYNGNSYFTIIASIPIAIRPSDLLTLSCEVVLVDLVLFLMMDHITGSLTCQVMFYSMPPF